MLEGVYYECILDYENITNIYFGCGTQSHKFDSCKFYSKIVAFNIEKFQEISLTDEALRMNKEEKSDSHDAEWVKVRLKRALKSTRNQGRMQETFQNDPLFQDNQNVKNNCLTSFSATAAQESKGMGLSGRVTSDGTWHLPRVASLTIIQLVSSGLFPQAMWMLSL